jgi:toxin-antitoxin system PIN domain toxin
MPQSKNPRKKKTSKDSGFLFDANLWVALAFADHPHHQIAVAAYRSATEVRPALFCRATQQTFLRLTSTPAFLRLCNATGLTNRDALAMLERFMASKSVSYREEPSGVAPLWHRLAALDSAAPKIWMDAYLAAFAISGDLQMVTLDHDFKAFESHGLQLQLLNSTAT